MDKGNIPKADMMDIMKRVDMDEKYADYMKDVVRNVISKCEAGMPPSKDMINQVIAEMEKGNIKSEADQARDFKKEFLTNKIKQGPSKAGACDSKAYVAFLQEEQGKYKDNPNSKEFKELSEEILKAEKDGAKLDPELKKGQKDLAVNMVQGWGRDVTNLSDYQAALQMFSHFKFKFGGEKGDSDQKLSIQGFMGSENESQSDLVINLDLKRVSQIQNISLEDFAEMRHANHTAQVNEAGQQGPNTPMSITGEKREENIRAGAKHDLGAINEKEGALLGEVKRLLGYDGERNGFQPLPPTKSDIMRKIIQALRETIATQSAEKQVDALIKNDGGMTQ
jgi:hypothetical protein